MGNLLSLFNSFLTNRYQRVVVNSSFSEWLPVCLGVPQGSVLGPLLFLLYIVEIHHNIISNSTVKLFANDITLYKQIVTTHDEALHQGDLTKMGLRKQGMWAHDIFLIFHTSLTHNVLHHYAMAMKFLAISKHLIGFMMQVSECKYSVPILRYDL